MKSLRSLAVAAALLSLIGAGSAQTIPNSLSFSTRGSFSNGVNESGRSVLIADNNLTDGYASGFDLKDAPSNLNTAGSAAFQWGTASSTSSYPHASALWFSPSTVSNVGAEQTFKIADLYYRNGTIVSNTGASSVDLNLELVFTSPSGTLPIDVSYTMDLINTVNGSDPAASADIVRFGNHTQALPFTDANGKQYYLDLTFKPNDSTIAGTMSDADQFRVTEGTQAQAELWGHITTSPLGSPVPVPEPSALLLGGLGSLMLFRRRR